MADTLAYLESAGLGQQGRALRYRAVGFRMLREHAETNRPPEALA